MAICHRLELLTADGLLHVFTQYNWSTEYSAYNVRSERVRGATENNILEIAPLRNRFGHEVESHQSVTLPSISRILKRGKFTVLPGMSRSNPTYDVKIGRVVAVHRTEGQYVTA